MTLTTDVKRELVAVTIPKTAVRAAQLATILRLAGGLHVISSRLAVECELDDKAVVYWVRKALAEIYGMRSSVAVLSAAGRQKHDRYLVRVVAGGETLARQTGLVDARRRAIRGLPNRLTTGSITDVAGIWRGAFLARGTLTEPGRTTSLDVVCPTNETAMALVGAANRLGVVAKSREVRGVNRVVVRDAEAISTLLQAIGAPRTVEAWEGLRAQREVRATANRLVNFDDANLRRSAQAAVSACARVERALQILGDDAPEHLRYAGQLRLQHREASLDELGRHAEPIMTKDAVAGRIRRLLAMADKRAQERGLPSTEAELPGAAEPR